MPQPSKSEISARLRAKYGKQAGSVSTGGGKNRMRRKKFKQKKTGNEFENRLQSNLKRLSCNTIPGIEEVNLFKSDGTVIHFVSPKVEAEVSSNTFIVSGQFTHNNISDLLPDILPQIGSDHLTQLKDYAQKFEALNPNNDDDKDMQDDVPMLIDEDLNFEQVAQSDELKQENKEHVSNESDDDDDDEKENPKDCAQTARSELRNNNDGDGSDKRERGVQNDGDGNGDDDSDKRDRGLGGDNVRNTRDRDSLKERFVTELPEMKETQKEEVFYNYQFGFFIDYWSDKQRNYVSAKYTDLKDELLNNALYPIAKDAYNATHSSAQDVYKKVGEILHSQNTIAKNEGIKNALYGIAVGSEITFNHIFALKLYTDRDKLQYELKYHCYRVGAGEGIEDCKKKHCEFANWLKLLREAIWMFGDELGRDTCVYHGLSGKLAFSSYTCVFPGIVSTTVDVSVAHSFCQSSGVILQFVNPESRKQRYFDVSGLSGFPNEKEYLFFETRLEIWGMSFSVMDKWTDINIYCQVLRLYQNLMDGIVFSLNKYSKSCVSVLKKMLKFTSFRFTDPDGFYAKLNLTNLPYVRALFERLFGEYEVIRKERWCNVKAIDGLKKSLKENVFKYMDLDCFELKGKTMNIEWAIGQNELDALVNDDTAIIQNIKQCYEYSLFDGSGIVVFYFEMYVDDESSNDSLSKPIRMDLVLYNVVIANRLKFIENSVTIGYDVFCDELNGKPYFNHFPMENHSDQARMDGDDDESGNVNANNSYKMEETVGDKYFGNVFFSKEMIANEKNGIVFNISVRAKPINNCNYNPETDFTELELVCKWLENEVGLPQYVGMFVEEGYDEWEMIKDLDKETLLQDLGINDQSHLSVIVNAIKQLP